MSHLFISAAHKSSGKTTVSIGLCAALNMQDLKVQAFKKGPDYIDPMWLGMATGRPCYNLDYYTMAPGEISQCFASHMQDKDIGIIEGNKGLYDGLDLDGSNSNAALAKLTGSPVVLVLDARGMTRGIAPLVLGYQDFDKDINIAGVILNQVGGSRHEGKLRNILEHYTDVKVLGAIHKNPGMEIDERHLGLVPSNEADLAVEKVRMIGNTIREEVDLDQLLTLSETAAQPAGNTNAPAVTSTASTVKIGIARDNAFGFYYQDDIEALQAAGAEIHWFNTLTDSKLPDVDGLFIGGGFPETHMQELSGNTTLLQDIRQAIEAGMPAYAECGGLMYLARSLSWNDSTCELVGAIAGDIVMHDRPQGRGYIQLQETDKAPWPGDKQEKDILYGHEFHYSSIENLPANTEFAYDVKRGHGIDGKHDGIICHNLVANYAHLRSTDSHQWAKRFVEFIRKTVTEN